MWFVWTCWAFIAGRTASFAPPPVGACSEGVRELLGEMLQLRPSLRPSAQSVLQHPALRPVIDQLQPHAPPPAAPNAGETRPGVTPYPPAEAMASTLALASASKSSSER